MWAQKLSVINLIQHVWPEKNINKEETKTNAMAHLVQYRFKIHGGSPVQLVAQYFYPHDAMLARVIVIATCLSVRHAPVLCHN